MAESAAISGNLVKIVDMVCGKDVPRIGQLLVEGGYIIQQDLDFALEHQKYTNQLLGGILIRMGAVDPEELDKIVLLQQSAKRC